MPHLILEYTNNLPEPVDFKTLFGKMHRALVEVASVQMYHIKSRAIGYDDFLIGEGKPENIFVHLTVAIWTGRTMEQQKEIGEKLLVILREGFAGICEKRPCDITIYIREMCRETYGKYMSEPAGKTE